MAKLNRSRNSIIVNFPTQSKENKDPISLGAIDGVSSNLK